MLFETLRVEKTTLKEDLARNPEYLLTDTQYLPLILALAGLHIPLNLYLYTARAETNLKPFF
jgi:hypothetical protein